MNIEFLYTLFTEHPVISTDSRNTPNNCIFFALKGDNFNGNEFALKALESGAAYSIIDDENFAKSERCILVKNVLECLHELANFHRKKMQIPFIAVCGSNGKTTTKELLFAVLNKKYNTIATKGNLNNHIGVPLTLLSVTRETEMAIIEIGANHIGETEFLCEIAMPDYGIITNNGKDHLEGFGSIEGVRKANTELYKWLKKSNGLAFVNDTHPDLMEDSSYLKRKRYGINDTSDYQFIPHIDESFATLTVLPEGIKIHSQLAGFYNWENIATAISIGKYFNVSIENIKEAISSYTPGMNRSQVLVKGNTTFIMDCYNANPSSMKLALESFNSTKSELKTIILGDMLELGKYSEEEHKTIVDLLSQLHFNQIVLVGKEFSKCTSPLNIIYFETTNQAKDWFKKQNWDGWTILLKGSRGYQLEKIIEESH